MLSILYTVFDKHQLTQCSWTMKNCEAEKIGSGMLQPHNDNSSN